jgi:hypothetical protein
MKRKLEIEATLERSLRRQVVAPKLDRRFDTAVWARIDAENARTANPVSQRVAAPSAWSRWIFISNVVGIGVAVLLIAIFGTQLLAGVDMNVPAPQLSPTTIATLLSLVPQVVSAAALLFGLMFTPIGRRLRAEFS